MATRHFLQTIRSPLSLSKLEVSQIAHPWNSKGTMELNVDV